jgi:hypothetical protein
VFKLRPDLTIAQLIGVVIGGVPILANLLRAFGVFDVTPGQLEALEQAGQFGALTAGALFVSDAALRAARNAHDAKVSAANVSAAAVAGNLPAGPGGGVPLGDLEAEGVPSGELPSDAEELGSPPLQPSQDPDGPTDLPPRVG